MSEEVKSLLAVITDMHKEQREANKLTYENLSKLRDTMHNLANDMAGVSQLTTILHTDVSDLKKQREADLETVHGHINRETKELSVKLEGEVGKLELKRDELLYKWEKRIIALEKSLGVIFPQAEAFGKIMDNIVKAVILLVIGVLASAFAFFYGDN